MKITLESMKLCCWRLIGNKFGSIFKFSIWLIEFWFGCCWCCCCCCWCCWRLFCICSIWFFKWLWVLLELLLFDNKLFVFIYDWSWIFEIDEESNKGDVDGDADDASYFWLVFISFISIISSSTFRNKKNSFYLYKHEHWIY